MTETTAPERALVFSCGGEPCVGVLHAAADGPGRVGVVLVVGGPQYRAGSHRQFVHLARHLAAAGFPVLRFDYRGMGDSAGAVRDFLAIDDDIAAAVAALRGASPDLEHVVLWGLCDAASAILRYAGSQPDVTAVMLANPWVHRADDGGAADEVYYRSRLFSPALWRAVLRGEVDVLGGVTGLAGVVKRKLAGLLRREAPATSAGDYVAAMREGLERYSGRVYLILSGRDLTADEFRDLARRDPAWRRLTETRVADTLRLADADHTFSSRAAKDAVAAACIDWLRRL